MWAASLACCFPSLLVLSWQSIMVYVFSTLFSRRESSDWWRAGRMVSALEAPVSFCSFSMRRSTVCRTVVELWLQHVFLVFPVLPSAYSSSLSTHISEADPKLFRLLCHSFLQWFGFVCLLLGEMNNSRLVLHIQFGFSCTSWNFNSNCWPVLCGSIYPHD